MKRLIEIITVLVLLVIIVSCSKATFPQEPKISLEDDYYMAVIADMTSFRSYVILYGDSLCTPTHGILYKISNGKYIGKFWRDDTTWYLKKPDTKKRIFDIYREIPQMKMFDKDRKPKRKQDGGSNV